MLHVSVANGLEHQYNWAMEPPWLLQPQFLGIMTSKDQTDSIAFKLCRTTQPVMLQTGRDTALAPAAHDDLAWTLQF